MRTALFYLLFAPITVFAQCWESLDIDGDTSSVHFAIRSDKSLWQLNPGSSPTLINGQNNWKKCISTSSSVFALGEDSTLWGFGNNYYGELGTPNAEPSLIQVNPDKWISFGSCGQRNYGIKDNGTLWKWESNQPIPAQVGTDTDWTEVHVSWGGIVARKSNGTLWAGSSGNLPVQQGTATDWNYFWSNSQGWFATKNNGTLWYDDWWTTTSLTQIGTGSDWKFITGEYDLYAIKNNGSLWFWPNQANFLTTSPQQVVTTLGFQSVSTGNNAIYGITEDNLIFMADVIWGSPFPPYMYEDTSATNVCSNSCIVVYIDVNQNCVQDGEIGMIGVPVTIQPGGFVTTTNGNGSAELPFLPDGMYTAYIDSGMLNWSPSCSASQTFQVVNGVAGCVNIGVISDNPCSNPNVSVYAPFLRPCLPNQMVYVQACNEITATSMLTASYVDVELDPLMVVTSSTIPYTIQSPNIYRFQTGNLNPGQCTNFSISTTIGSPAIGCASLLGQTLCMDATLFPAQSCALDTVPSNPPTTGGGTLNGFPQPCTLPWDQSSLSVDGWCANDSIYFTITNTGQPGGGDMECYSPMWITVDGVVTYTDSIMIPGGQTITLSFPGDGQTWQLNASQHPLHPGNSNPNAYVELCGDSTNFTPGLVNELPLNDADPVVDIYCGTVTGSYDPNDKTGYPTGQTDQKYIQPNQQLQYMIRFQNTGTDTAFTVVIRDTLDTDLNIFTVTPGVASHPYTFKMYGPRVLEWTFDNINLPDSTTDQAGSNGFATFHVEQVPNLAPGTVINNDADIYFDFNDPITTNTTVHRIYEGFVSVAALEEMIASKPSILVYPNPTSGSFTIRMDKASAEQTYRIFDQQGRTVKTGNLDGKQTPLELNGLSGMYYLMVGQEVVKVQVIK